MGDELEDVLQNFTAQRFKDIKKYAKGDYIGQGAFGVVYKYQLRPNGTIPFIKLYSTKLPRVVAIKMLHQDVQRATEPANRLNIIREVNVHGSLEHPNVIRCHGYCRVDNAISLVLEFCETDLGRYLKDAEGNKLGKQEARSILCQLCSALDYMRQQGKHGIIHRDLKPSNILIRNVDPIEVAVSDFGLAKFITPCNSTITRVGSPAYCAPEVLDECWDLRLSNSGDNGHATDIYSLGVVAFQLTTGILLPKASIEERVTRTFHEDKHLIQDPNLTRFIESCLRWNPQERIKKDGLLGHPYFEDTYIPRIKDVLEGPKTPASSHICTTLLIGKRRLLCGHKDGTLGLMDLEDMAFVATAKEHSEQIKQVVCNSTLLVCASHDGDATIWEIPDESNPSLNILTRMRNPLGWGWICSCSMNETHLALGAYKIVQVYAITEKVPKLVTSFTEGLKTWPKGIRFPKPVGNLLWVPGGDCNAILYEGGVEVKRAFFRDKVTCIAPSRYDCGKCIWVGTSLGCVFKYDCIAETVVRMPADLEGRYVRQIEEVGDKLVIRSGAHPDYFLTQVSAAGDWTEARRVFPDAREISYFSVVADSDAAVAAFGIGRTMYFAPL